MARRRRHKQINAATATRPVIGMTAEVAIKAGETEGGPKRFDVVAYTGGMMQVEGYKLPVVVDLAGMTFGKSIVANLDHQRSQRVGNVSAHTIDGGQLTLSGYASAATPYRDEVVASAADGFVWQASIEASPTKMDDIPAGRRVKANGQEFEGPFHYVTASTLKGFAFVSHGADDNTTVTIAATSANTTKGTNMEPKFKAWLEAMDFDPSTMTETQVAGLKAQFDGIQPPKPPSTHAKLDDILAERKAENKRQEQIADITATALADQPHLFEEIQALAQNAIDAKWTAERYELELLRATRPQGRQVFGGTRVDRQLTNDMLEATLCRTARLPDLEARFKPELLEASEKMYPNGIGLKETLITAARANGYATNGTSVTRDVLEAAFQSRQAGIRATNFSTLSVPGILSNTANKFLIRGFMSVEAVWRAIAKIRSVQDFKTVTSYTLTGGMTYDKVGPAGELHHGTVGEETYTNKADTYGKMFAITRQDIINDDLGALTEVPMRLGRGAAIKLNVVFWTEFLNNSTFFASGNSNVSTGAGSALGTAGSLNAAEVVFMNQTDPDGNPLGLMPKILLVPTTLKTTALTAMNSQYVIATDMSNAADSTAPSGNVYQGRFQVESSPYMENTSYTGYSTAAWYLLADPMDMATIEVCFLNGRDAPVVETADASFNTLGVEMRGYHDFGVNLQEYRAGVRSAGS